MWKEKLLKDVTKLVCCYFKKLLKPSMVVLGAPQRLEGGVGVLRKQSTPDPFWCFPPLFFPPAPFTPLTSSSSNVFVCILYQHLFPSVKPPISQVS